MRDLKDPKRRAPLRQRRKGKEGKGPALRAGRSTGKPTKAQERRFIAIKESGCLCCLLRGMQGGSAEIHHQNAGGTAGRKRLGHDFTIGLCVWHHRAGRPHGVTEREMIDAFGPPLTMSRSFRTAFGSDEELLKTQNHLIGSAGALP